MRIDQFDVGRLEVNLDRSERIFDGRVPTGAGDRHDAGRFAQQPGQCDAIRRTVILLAEIEQQFLFRDLFMLSSTTERRIGKKGQLILLTISQDTIRFALTFEDTEDVLNGLNVDEGLRLLDLLQIEVRHAHVTNEVRLHGLADRLKDFLHGILTVLRRIMQLPERNGLLSAESLVASANRLTETRRR